MGAVARPGGHPSGARAHDREARDVLRPPTAAAAGPAGSSWVARRGRGRRPRPGLAGHGRPDALLRLYKAGQGQRAPGGPTWPPCLHSRRRSPDRGHPAASGSSAQNITVRSYGVLRPRLCLDLAGTGDGRAWREKIRIRTPDVDNNILSLSGGNQQKSAVRAGAGIRCADRADGRSERGVDVETKREVYDLIRAEPARAAASSGTPPRWRSCSTATTSTSTAKARFVADLPAQTSPTPPPQEKVLHSSFRDEQPETVGA